MRRPGLPRVLLAICFLAGSFAAAADFHAKVGRFELAEIELAAASQPANPYVALNALATLTPPEGGKARIIPLFWDGGQRWKLRFSPDVVGRWTWSVTSPDSGLDGRSGVIEASESSSAGSIRPMKDFPLHFERQNSQPFFF